MAAEREYQHRTPTTPARSNALKAQPTGPARSNSVIAALAGGRAIGDRGDVDARVVGAIADRAGRGNRLTRRAG
ncbi:MAG: hypothetical protein JWN65_2694 [Solirubrobacterales bacterium]|nr:hypothetical protein [Solirubrobacterales bacterium]